MSQDDEVPIFDDARDEVKRRADAAGIPTRVDDMQELYGFPAPDYELYLNLPNGRNRYSVLVDPDNAVELSELQFENYIVLGKYEAIYDKGDSTIEAVVRPVTAGLTGRTSVTPRFFRLPGVELFKRGEEPGEPDIPISDFGQLLVEDAQAITRALSRSELKHRWRLPIQTEMEGMQAEISPVSDKLPPLSPQISVSNASLKVSGFNYDKHEECVRYLEQVAANIFFEIDLRFGVSYTLGRQFSRGVRLGRTRTDERPIALPKVQYSVPATTLYFYARSAGNILNKYLAYYQAIEYFFPSFFNREVIERLRNKLRDPRFDNSIDNEIQQLINIAAGGKRQSATEHDQLRATVRRSVSDDELSAYLDEDREAKEFLAKDKLLADKRIQSSGSNTPSLVEQLSDRIYAVRCRIVHVKEAGGDGLVEPLLPYSEEADRMQHDLHLIQFVCQKVIIAGSR